MRVYKVEEVKVNAALAAHRVSTHDSLHSDVTREFKMLGVPAITNEESVIINTGYDSCLEAGTVSGEVLIAEPKEQTNTAPLGAVILPKGSSLRLYKGDVLTLHTHGYVPRNDLVSGQGNRSFMIEVMGETATLSGPLLISPSSLPKGTLDVIERQESALSQINKTLVSAQTPIGLISFGLLVFGFLGLLSIPILIKRGSDGPAVFFLLTATGLGSLLYLKTSGTTRKIRSVITGKLFSKEAMNKIKMAEPNGDIDYLLQNLTLETSEDIENLMTKSSANIAFLDLQKSLKLIKADVIHALPARFTKVNDKIPLRILENLTAIEDKRNLTVIESPTREVSGLH